ncbi:hypothetical protein GDO86_013818 [Hymenochirus boettgeri]|uniref:(E3-independent) E2 ubiquitin-conjugating enzyme n=1 Tax=Hymenochirus boettgeri TaxID=247094 RepID=A0A8T2JP89_9PIPI|nr:hypothetical protein GDO86_013818 [Hymenochirus boettgeri]
MANVPDTAPSSSPPGPPAGDGSQRLLFSHDLVSGCYRGQCRFGLVRLIHGEDSDSEEEEDAVLEEDEAGGGRKKGGGVTAGGGGGRGSPCSEPADEGSRFGPLRRGYVRVQWYPEGIKQDVRETKLKLEDRSLVPRDVVRRLGSKDSQCGTVIDVNIECVVKLVGTDCFLHPVNSKELHHIWPIMYGDYIAYDCWLGKVYDLKNQVILKLSNGSRCSMSTEDASKLYDVCPHASDSGLFFDDSYGFYPGQILIGPAKVFSNVQWISGVKPVLSVKSKFRVGVEEVQVTELRVTWITKSFCLGGTDSMDPPSSVITQDNLARVKRLGSFDHTQRQLGERCLYIFPTKVEPTKILCESLEKNCLLGEVTVTKKQVDKLRDKQIVKIISCTQHSSNTNELLKKNTVVPPASDGNEAEADEASGEQFNECPTKDLQFGTFREIFQDLQLQSREQDADDEAAGDTDDASSVTSSASSTTSSQSGGGTGRKKSIPLSIRNLKRKHKKKKKSKVYREFKPGDRVAVEVITTVTTADVMWQDGTVETNIRSNDLLPIQHLDNNEFCPGDFVVDKRAHVAHDTSVYGVVQSGDHTGRTCVVKWIRLNLDGDDIEVIGEEEDVSVYDITDHPDFRFRSTDIVIRIGSSEPEDPSDTSQPSVGQVARVDVSSKVEVIWPDNSKTVVLPQHLYNVESELEESFYDSAESSSSGASSDEWEDDSDSWETDNGLTEDEVLRPAGEEVTSTPNQSIPAEQAQEPEQDETENNAASVAAAAALGVPGLNVKGEKEGIVKSFKELKEAIKILESLKNMTVEQLLMGSPTSPTAEPEKFTREKKFLDDIKKLQENLKKTLDNVAIVEEEKMESAPEGEKEEKADAQTPVRSEWPSDTPVLCQQSGGKPGVIFTSAKGEVFSVLESAPESHAFKKLEFQAPEAKKFFSTVRKEMALLATSLPDGIMVKTFEDRMDLFSAFIKGPTRTPYEDGLFLFDMQLPNIYPAVPPLFRYLSQCSGRLNPNLYDNGKVCVSLLGTWIGKGTERWTSKSSLLQVLISIQGLILVNEPYYNEAGFDSDRGLQEGYENSRCYNEMSLIRVVQSMTQLVRRPVEVFQLEVREHFQSNGWRLAHRIETWLETNSLVEKGGEIPNSQDHPCIVPYSPTEPECTPDPPLDSKDLDDSGCGASTMSPGETQAYSDLESTSKGAVGGINLSEEPRGAAGGVQPSVKPKKRRKSYRSFLPDKRGYPDIGFPLFPLSKGFIKSIQGVLAQYKAALLEAGISEPRGGRLALPL